MDSITKQETFTGRSKVTEEISINYTYASINGSQIDRLNATVRKNDLIVGYYNSAISGESGFSFTAANNLTIPEKEAITSRLFIDEQSVFNPTPQ